MFHHVKDLQFNARVSGPDPKFASLLLEQFGGGNGELKAAMQYFVQSFGCRQAYPDKYDLLMDIATEEFSHLEIVGATITMLLDGVNGRLKDAAEGNALTGLMGGGAAKEDMIHQAMVNPQFLVLNGGGGPTVTDSHGHPWSGAFVNANGDLTVDLRSNIGAESRAKIVYEYLLQFTNDPYVQESLRFLMTREIAHFQMFAAALEDIQPNFPPGILQGDPRFTHAYYNTSKGEDARGPWNQGQGPWPAGEEWEFIEDPVSQARQTRGQTEKEIAGTKVTPAEAEKLERQLGEQRSTEISSAVPKGENQWSTYGEAAPPIAKQGGGNGSRRSSSNGGRRSTGKRR
jgi:Mn-containing catalase